MLADEGKAKAVAFDEIDKAPEEKKRGITIATVWNRTLLFLQSIVLFSAEMYTCSIFRFSGSCGV